MILCLQNASRLSETVSHLGLSVLRIRSDRFASGLVVVSLGGHARPHLARERQIREVCRRCPQPARILPDGFGGGRPTVQVRESPAMNHMTPNERDPADQAETLDLINAEVTASLTQQADASAKLETKALTLVGYVGVLSAFLATRNAQPVAAGCAYLAYAIAAGLDIAAFMLGPELRLAASPGKLFDGFLQRSKIETLEALVTTRVKAFDYNQIKLERKARFAQISLIFLVGGVLLMAVAIIEGSLNAS